MLELFIVNSIIMLTGDVLDRGNWEILITDFFVYSDVFELKEHEIVFHCLDNHSLTSLNSLPITQDEYPFTL